MSAAPGGIRTFLEHRLAVAGLAIIVLITLFCFVGPEFYHTDQVNTFPAQVLLRPGGTFPLGTDALGHNVLGRLMLAGQSSLEVGVSAAILAVCVGALWGATAGSSAAGSMPS